MAHSLESLPPHSLSLELNSVYLFKVFGWAISIKLISSVWEWIFFFFWLVCLNDDWVVPLINKVVNTDRNNLRTMCGSKGSKSKDGSSEVWAMSAGMGFGFVLLF